MKTLLYLEESLPASIALRFVDQQARMLGMAVQPFHVEEPDKKLQAGTGWVRRSWERGVVGAGLEEVLRLLKTEKVDLPGAGQPRVVVGDRDAEVLEELQHTMYDQYAEGYLNTARTEDFVTFLSQRRFQKMTVPVLVAKNLVPAERVVLLVGDGVDVERLVPAFLRLYGKVLAGLDLSVICYRFQEKEQLAFLDRQEGGGPFERLEAMLAVAGGAAVEYLVVQGSPESMAIYLQEHGLVATTFPTRRGPRMELLALLANPLLLCR